MIEKEKAELLLKINEDGSITSVTIVNPGNGYTSSPVVPCLGQRVKPNIFDEDFVVRVLSEEGEK